MIFAVKIHNDTKVWGLGNWVKRSCHLPNWELLKEWCRFGRKQEKEDTELNQM